MAEGFPPFLPLNKGTQGQPRPGPQAQQPFPNPPIHAIPTGPRQGMPPSRQVHAMNPQAQMAGHMSPQHFPHLPMHAMPEDLRPHASPARSHVEISDIRGEWLTEAEAREVLSTLVIMRLEKTDRIQNIEEDGSSMRSTWDRVKRFRVTDISQQEAKRRVRVLEQETKPVSKKKEACGLAVQRQLELAQQSLDHEDLDKRFCHKLVQFDSKTRPLDPALLEYSAKHSKKDKGKRGKKLKLPTKERIAITAYFQRSPTSEQSSTRILKDLQMEREMRARGQMPSHFPQSPSHMGSPAFNHPQPVNPPQQVMPQKPAQAVQPKPSLPKKPQGQQQPPQGQQQKPLAKQPQVQQQQQQPLPKQPQGQQQQQLLQKVLPKHPQGVPPQKVPLQGQQQKVDHQKQPHIVVEEFEDEKPSRPDQDKNKNRSFEPLKVQIKNTNRHYPDSPRSSQSSFDDRSSSSSISDSSTVPSSLGSSSGASKHHRSRGRSRGRSRTPVYRDEPAHFGRPEKDIYVERRRVTNPRFVRTPSPRGSPIGGSPYPGSHDHQYTPYNSRTAPPPRIFQPQSGVRHVAPPMARREVIRDDLQRAEDQIRRIRLNADYRGEDILRESSGRDRLGEVLHRRRVLENELNGLPSEEARHRPRVLEHELNGSPWPEDDAVEYMDARSRERRPLPVREGRRL